ncbi:hypothetical protein SteCoe_34097 [Stentor coeruleus]|uniref:SCP domain-containing protein n=1 Tax=Stentor coeruleus TaxID=5963 RepID=A0A1R2AVH2_9CILI|nr:hypothetical protein SteCoe_34097 [Stentor coeruleus]
MSTFQLLIQEIYDEINQLRENPKHFAEKLEYEFDNYKSNNARHRPGTVPVLTREGLKAVKEAHEELENIESLPPLQWSEGLSIAALSHCNDTGPLGIVGHIGSKETTLQQRIERNGKWSESIAEALDYGSVSGFEVVMSLLVDDGLTTRPHRKALLNPNYSKVGIGAAPHSEFKTVACILFAVSYDDNEDIEPESISDGKVPSNPEVSNWLDGAVKLTCEVRVETENGVSVRKAKKYWEMHDGTIQITEEVLTPKGE